MATTARQIQFGLRSVFAATTFVALVSATAGWAMRNWDSIAGSIGWPDSYAMEIAERSLIHATCDVPVLVAGAWMLRGGRRLTRSGRSIAGRLGMALVALAWAVTCVTVVHFCLSITSSFLWMISAAVG